MGLGKILTNVLLFPFRLVRKIFVFFLKVITFGRYGIEERRQKEIENYYKSGSVVLPTDLRDYENLEEFEELTKDNSNIQNRLQEIKNMKQYKDGR